MTQLSQDKLKALEEFGGFLLDTTKDKFILQGPPGTGKTLMLPAFMRTLLEQSKVLGDLLHLPEYQDLDISNIRVCAFTHQAVNEAQKSLNKYPAFTGIKCSTIHSSFRLFSLIHEFKELNKKRNMEGLPSFTFKTPVKEVYESSNAYKLNKLVADCLNQLFGYRTTQKPDRTLFLFLEEASQISEEMAFFVDLVINSPLNPHRVRKIVIGDRFQIPPVSKSKTMQVSPLFKEDDKTVTSELTERFRYSNDGAIKQNNINIQNVIKAGYDENLVDLQTDETFNFVDSDQAAELIYDRLVENPDPNFKVIGYRNQTLKDISDFVETQLKKEGKGFKTGDARVTNSSLLITERGASYSRDISKITCRNLSQHRLECKIEVTEKATSPINNCKDLFRYCVADKADVVGTLNGSSFRLSKCPVMSDKAQAIMEGKIPFDSGTYFKVKDFIKHIDMYGTHLIGGPQPKGTGHTDFSVTVPQLLVFSKLISAQVTTAHKAQGATFGSSLVLLDDIAGADSELRWHLLNVAITRSQECYILEE